ncbi:hypothetical protein BDN72DRAFT_847659 [Pluteus cervinus]|uniref:Uncharacterized protein n=1 Tax=Pluteus cervinus TaxID=181527 RepID=A0ACD3ACR1_9AGAR|nr:hypothetical protein BDN72DRAFT_847659 [Pluteus cervinus]
MSTFSCPCCGEDVVHYPIPAAPDHANPLSAKKSDSLVNDLTQCQYCSKSKAQGATLSKCAGCLIDIYCSKECQKKAWPTHKIRCKLNQRTKNRDPVQTDKFKLLRAFTSKHRPMLATAGVRALELGIHPDNATNKALMVIVRERPAKRVELSFFAIEAEVVSIDSFGKERAEEMRGQLKLTTDVHRLSGSTGTFFVILHEPNSGLMNIMPVGFSADGVYNRPMPWKESLLKNLNEGIVT